jgi:hypothetical protein
MIGNSKNIVLISFFLMVSLLPFGEGIQYLRKEGEMRSTRDLLVTLSLTASPTESPAAYPMKPTAPTPTSRPSKTFSVYIANTC